MALVLLILFMFLVLLVHLAATIGASKCSGGSECRGHTHAPLSSAMASSVPTPVTSVATSARRRTAKVMRSGCCTYGC